MKKKFTAISFIILFGLVHGLHAQQFAKVGTAGSQFLKIGAGARNVGMGNACGAMVSDASAMFWNVGGLAMVENYSVMLSNVQYLADIQINSVAIAKTFPGLGTFGVSAMALGSGDMEITTFTHQDGTGETFSKNDVMIGLSYSNYLTVNFSFGGTIKLVREDYGSVNGITGDDEIATNIAFDLGAIYRTGFKSLRLGIAIMNFGPEMQIPGQYRDIVGFDAEKQEYITEPADEYRPYHLPLMFRAGFAFDVYESEMHKITVAGDLLHPNDNVEQVNLGGEYWFNKLIALRGGFIGNHDSANFSVGGSLRVQLDGLGAASIDYSYTDYGILDLVHQMALVLEF